METSADLEFEKRKKKFWGAIYKIGDFKKKREKIIKKGEELKGRFLGIFLLWYLELVMDPD